MSEQCWTCESPLLSDGFCALCPRLIETAPKDGTYLLLFSDRMWAIGAMFLGEWESLEEQARLTPTHWLPLPPAPL